MLRESVIGEVLIRPGQCVAYPPASWLGWGQVERFREKSLVYPIACWLRVKAKILYTKKECRVLPPPSLVFGVGGSDRRLIECMFFF